MEINSRKFVEDKLTWKKVSKRYLEVLGVDRKNNSKQFLKINDGQIGGV